MEEAPTPTITPYSLESSENYIINTNIEFNNNIYNFSLFDK